MENIMSSKLFRTRQGTILLGVVAAVLAAIALIVYLNQYRNSVNTTVVPSNGAGRQEADSAEHSGEVIASSGLYKIKTVRAERGQAGAFTTHRAPGHGREAGIPGAAADHRRVHRGKTADPLPHSIPHGERAVVVPLESPGQVGNQICRVTDVDVYVLITAANGTPVVKRCCRTCRDEHELGRQRDSARDAGRGRPTDLRGRKRQDLAHAAAAARLRGQESADHHYELVAGG